MNDRQLVHEFLSKRSENAFRMLYRDKTPHLYRMALRLTQDEHLSQELIQEMWLIAIRSLPEFEWRSELKTWLTGILINLSRKLWKDNEMESRKRNASREWETTFEMSFASSYDLEKGISTLPPGYRQIIILFDIEGYKHAEISRLLNISEGTSKSQLFHARKALRAYLSEDLSKKHEL